MKVYYDVKSKRFISFDQYFDDFVRKFVHGETEEKKTLDWQLKCAKCGFEFSIMFDSDESEETKNEIRRCPCGGGLMEIVKEKVF